MREPQRFGLRREELQAWKRPSRWSAPASGLFLLFLVLCACSQLSQPQRSAYRAGGDRQAALACREVPHLTPLLEPGATLLLGELHGTVESPEFAENAVCLALRAGRSVALGLEIPREESPLVETFLASSGRPEDRSALLASPFWSSSYQDGRRSQSRLALLDQVRRWRREGRPIRVVLFDRAAQPSSGQERDRWMAQELHEAITSRPQDLFVALAGNVHMRIGRGVPWDAQYEPAGFLLVQALPRRPTAALDVAYTQGTAWFCTSADAASCQVRAVKQAAAPQGTQGIQVVLYPDPKDGYNGIYRVGLLTASPPAVAPKGGAANPVP